MQDLLNQQRYSSSCNLLYTSLLFRRNEYFLIIYRCPYLAIGTPTTSCDSYDFSNIFQLIIIQFQFKSHQLR